MTRTALVTGTSRGLGLALVETFLAEDWQVVSLGRRAHESFSTFTERFCHLPCDLADGDETIAACEQVRKRLDGLDILVNNAAICVPSREDLEDDAFDVDRAERYFRVNALAPLRLTRGLIGLLKCRHGMLLNISSEAGSFGSMNVQRTSGFDYCMSKAALNMQTKLLRKRYEAEGVAVHAMHPGGMTNYCPNGRYAPEDIARFIVTKVATRNQEFPAFFGPEGEELSW